MHKWFNNFTMIFLKLNYFDLYFLPFLHLLETCPIKFFLLFFSQALGMESQNKEVPFCAFSISAPLAFLLYSNCQCSI